MTAEEIQDKLEKFMPYKNIYIPEFIWTNKRRIDGIVIDFRHRWIRGFEIKTSMVEYRQDKKWTSYAKFCSALAIACPPEVIYPDDVPEPFGLVWVKQEGWILDWQKPSKPLHDTNSPEWQEIYTKVLELEFPRLYNKLNTSRERVTLLEDKLNKIYQAK